jgi:hypothetical protein
MNWLRLILLVGGLLFIAVLIWLERRRPSRVQQEAEYRGERNEPAFGFADEVAQRSRASAASSHVMVSHGMDSIAMPALSPRGPIDRLVDTAGAGASGSTARQCWRRLCGAHGGQ